MSRTLAHSLFTITERDNKQFSLWSLYDRDIDLIPQYLPAANFRGFNRNLFKFITNCIQLGKQCDVIILSHINLAIVGVAIKLLYPACKVVLIAHGVEVWRPLTLLKRALLKYCDRIICVSNFTRLEVIRRHNTLPEKCIVIHNVVDPFMKLPVAFNKPDYLINRYGLSQNDNIVFTLTRLASSEQYKGYDQVLQAITLLKPSVQNLKYLLSGQYDKQEEQRIRGLINQYNLQEHVILTGFVKDEEITDHFLLADVFTLPSKKEGFGIVFIEALACGLPVICGNVDGSMDAIRQGELGTAINPDVVADLAAAMLSIITNKPNHSQKMLLQKECLRYFNEDNYMVALENVIKE